MPDRLDNPMHTAREHNPAPEGVYGLRSPSSLRHTLI